MSLSWNALHAQLVLFTTTSTFRTDYTRVRQAAPEVHQFRHPAELFAVLHDPRASKDRQNAILRDLIGIAQADRRLTGTTVNLVLLALWPGLERIYHQLRRCRTAAQEDLAAEVSARATLQILSVDLDRVNVVAGTIVMNVRRDSLRVAMAQADLAAGQTDCCEATISQVHSGPAVEEIVAAHQAVQALGRDADLVMDVVISGLTQAEAGARMGLNPSAARKRYQRAITQVRRVL